ncbi:hypothetical protein [Actinoplanes sp. L3-i22]|uniref:hypothetical protein n=1 Tax=Actinoplanes sp. L3-i22 TaxID=2836373 RepID=UPI001C78418F|nr:hypothetical protein [Actinoplanes sp. L3-i22]BCY07183.1 hypothetical protein L3i22_022710 [Actinoplanes sp. L3-i22]
MRMTRATATPCPRGAARRERPASSPLAAPESAIVEYARTLARHVDRTGSGPASWAYPTSAHLLLAEGRLFTPAPLSAATRRTPGWRCYRNAATVARRHGLLYAEGLAATRIAGTFWSFPHAWCVTPEGNAVDPTWESGHGLAYLGIALTDPAHWPTDQQGSLLEDHAHGTPLLRDGVPDDMTAPLGRPIPAPRQGMRGAPLRTDGHCL